MVGISLSSYSLNSLMYLSIAVRSDFLVSASVWLITASRDADWMESRLTRMFVMYGMETISRLYMSLILFFVCTRLKMPYAETIARISETNKKLEINRLEIFTSFNLFMILPFLSHFVCWMDKTAYRFMILPVHFVFFNECSLPV